MTDFFTIANGWKVVIHKAAEGGYWGEVPAMPGCVSEGNTKAETLANVIEAARGCLDAYLSMAIAKLRPARAPRARRARVLA